MQAILAGVLGISRSSIGADHNCFKNEVALIKAMRVFSTAYRAGHKFTVAMVFSDPILYHIASAAKKRQAQSVH